jgi:hypothetical protein
VPRGLVARLVVDAQAAVALEAAEGLLDLPATRLDPEALAAAGADDLRGDAVGLQESARAVAGEAAIEPGQEEGRGVGGEVGGERPRGIAVLDIGGRARPARRADRPRRRSSAPACGP